ncbi:MAG: MaoC/PaaZ C-terminal domain-containing protein [Actinomycetes bacterium]
MSIFKVGEVLPSKTYIINRASLVTYANASGDQNPIHQDEAFAKSVGLENVIAHGMYTMGLVGQYVSSMAGSSSKVREFSARFTKPVVVPAGVNVELVVSATVVELTDEVARLEITATCNEVKVLGMAKAVILL